MDLPIVFFGIVALIQMIILPGLCVLRWLGLPTQTLLQKVLFVFTMSLFVNTIIISLLVITETYTSTVMSILIVSQLSLLLLYHHKKPPQKKVEGIKKSAHIPSLLQFAITVCALLVLGRFLLLFIENIPLSNEFMTGDAIESWSRWAKEWARGILPTRSFHYPQLIPINWSLAYLFTHFSLDYFAKLIMPLFIIGILISFIDLYRQSKDTHYLLALITCGVLFHYYYDGGFLRDGYVDGAFTFFAWMPMYAYLSLSRSKDRILVYSLVFLTVAISLMVKQLGLLLLPLFAYWAIKDRSLLSPMHKTEKRKKIWALVIIAIIWSLAWQVFKLPESLNMINPNSIYLEATDHVLDGKGVLARFAYAFALLTPYWKGTLLVVASSLLLITGLFRSHTRTILILLVIPGFVVWVVLLGYDHRNMMYLIPYISYIIGRQIALLPYFRQSVTPR